MKKVNKVNNYYHLNNKLCLSFNSTNNYYTTILRSYTVVVHVIGENSKIILDAVYIISDTQKVVRRI